MRVQADCAAAVTQKVTQIEALSQKAGALSQKAGALTRLDSAKNTDPVVPQPRQNQPAGTALTLWPGTRRAPRRAGRPGRQPVAAR